VTKNSSGMTRAVLESQVFVPHSGQKQSGTSVLEYKAQALIMVKKLSYFSGVLLKLLPPNVRFYGY